MSNIEVAAQDAVNDKAPNIARMTCLRPKPEAMADFMPLWDKRNEVIAEKDRNVEAMMAAAQRGDMAAHAIHRDSVDRLQAQEDALSRQMRPLQNKAWERVEENLVTNVGRNDILDKYWRGSSYTQTVVMGLKGTGAPAAGDTQASHAGWSEVGGTNAPAYTGNRKAVTMGPPRRSPASARSRRSRSPRAARCPVCS